MTTYYFERFSHTVKRSVYCSGCHRKLTRQRTFTQTDNPFNKNADGTRKSIPQIRASLAEQGRMWIPSPLCTDCEATS